MDINEKALLYRAHAGDREAAGTLYERYYRDIYSYIFYRVNDSATAEELSAEVFVRMIQELPGKLEHGKPFISWLYSLAKTVIKDHAWLQDMTKTRDEVIDPSNGKTGEQGSQEALSCFMRALQHLSDSQRELIIHRFVEGRTLTDIADLIQQSERAVTELQYQALNALEEALLVEDCLE
jgi:RNA polymerase sigma-70 factor (ECF subfamily)